jgi:hypothetical protein
MEGWVLGSLAGWASVVPEARPTHIMSCQGLKNRNRPPVPTGGNRSVTGAAPVGSESGPETATRPDR